MTTLNLNQASALYYGSTRANRLYLGANLLYQEFNGNEGLTPPVATYSNLDYHFDAIDSGQFMYEGSPSYVIRWYNKINDSYSWQEPSGSSTNYLSDEKAIWLKNDFKLDTPINTADPNDSTIFTVMKVAVTTATNTFYRIISTYYTPNSSFHTWIGVQGIPVNGPIITSYNPSTTIYDPGVTVANWDTYLIVCNRRRYNPSNASQYLIRNKVNGQGLESTTPYTAITSNLLNYGYRLNVAGGPATDVKMKELLIYDRALTDAEIEDVEGYLAWRWGLNNNLVNTHPYYSTPYVN